MSSSKKAKAYIKLQIPAGKANPSPPVGPALGQHGLNIPGFCKEFNDRSKNTEVGLKLPVVISVYADKSYSFIIKTPPAAVLLKKVLGLNQGSATPNSKKVGVINSSQLAEVAQQKMPDLTASSLDAAIRTIAGTAVSMGLSVNFSEE